MKAMTMHSRKILCRQRGVAAVEFALVFLLFISVLYGAATFGAVFYTQQVLSRAAEDGARAISLLGVTPLVTNDPQITSVVYNSLESSLIAPATLGSTQAVRKTWIENPANVVVAIDPTCAGVTGCVKVTVQYQYSQNRILPVLPLISWAPNTLTASAIAPK